MEKNELNKKKKRFSNFLTSFQQKSLNSKALTQRNKSCARARITKILMLGKGVMIFNSKNQALIQKI